MPVSHKHASRRPAGSGRSGVCAGQADAHRCWRVCGWLVRQGRCPRASNARNQGSLEAWNAARDVGEDNSQ